MKEFKPMLASPADLDTLRYPLLASPKIDGIRAMVLGHRLVSRKLLDIPNKSITESLLSHVDVSARVAAKLTGTSPFEGLDGELLVGEPTAKDVYNKTVSFVMAQDKIDADWCYWVFDHHDDPLPFTDREARISELVRTLGHPRVKVLGQTLISDRTQLDAFEAMCIEEGYEGVMTRDPNSRYKYGRSTAKEQILLKVKRFEDSECEIIGIEEEMHNGNAAGRDELGRTKRSSAKEGKTGKGTMGALIVRDLKTSVVFNIGTGFTAAQRAAEWEIGSIHTYKFFPVGVKDKPRHPVYKGPRAAGDR
jgi:DNA ligase-1